MTDSRGDSGTLETVMKRRGILRRLRESPAHKRDLVDETDHSRSTINRAIRDLTEMNLVEGGQDGITVTPVGRLALDHLETFQSGFADIVESDSVIDPLPPETPLTGRAVVGSEARLAAEPVPYQSLEALHTALTDATRYRALLPGLDDPRQIRLLYEHVVTDENPADLVVTPELFETLVEEFPRQLAAMADCAGFRLSVHDDLPSFAVGLADDEGGTLVSVVVFTEHGAVHGTLSNDTSEAIRWGEAVFEEHRAEAVERTGELRSDESDSGWSHLADQRSAGQFLPARLAGEGFIELAVPYFREEPVADPTTAWRAGLSLAEVHTGYAIDWTLNREGEIGGGAEHESPAPEMTAQLLATLEAGDDCIVVGPPGSGKSTICKRVACSWYDEDRGRVLYREQGRGRPFESVEQLRETAEEADGHTLIVVEDAVRPEANTTFEALTRLSECNDVSFLFDACEHEWIEPPTDVGSVEDLRVVAMPALDEDDCKRLVDHFERTLGEPVDVPADQLYEDIRGETIGTDNTAPNELLQILHRLATYADPLAEDQTSLEEAVAAVYDELADDELALSVSILANALNAAGFAVVPNMLFAVGEPGEEAAVEAALDRLEGTVLFPQAEGSSRTVHEAWSVTYLEHVLETAGEPAATELFGDAVSSLLALADRSPERDRVVRQEQARQALPSTTNDLGEWVRGTVEGLYGLAMERPKLAPLYGDGEHDSIELPTATPESVVDHRPVWLGRAFLEGGYYDRAERAFKRLPAGTGHLAAQRQLGLARIAKERGEYGGARSHAQTCLELSEEMDWPIERARANLLLGQVASKQDNYETADRHHDSALEGFEEAGDQRGVASGLKAIGRNASRQGEYDRAREHHERALDIERELGDRQGEAQSLNNLGIDVRRQGEFDAAREYFEQALDIERELGDRQGEADTLNNIGIVDVIQGNYERAHEYLERSLDVTRKLGDRQGESSTLSNLGLLAERLGEYDQARTYHDRNLELKAELGDRNGRAVVLSNRALVALRQGEYDKAREDLERSVEISQELGSRQVEANSLGNLGHVFRELGEYDQAREHHEQSLAIKEKISDRQGKANSLTNLGILAREEEEYDRAREQFEAAADTLDGDGDMFRTAERQLERGRLALACDDIEAAREWGEVTREAFAGMSATHLEGRCRLLLGRVDAAIGDGEAAREHWQSALEAFETVGAPQDALTVLRELIEHCRAGDDGQALGRYRTRIETAVADAPAVAVQQHREWLDEVVEVELV